MTYSQRNLASLLLACAALLAAASTFASAGCATPAPPRELVDARAAYTEAESGNAGTLDPTAVHTAREALDRAEVAYVNDPRSQTVRDLAYIADRKAKLATARGNTAFAAREERVGRQRLDVLAKDTSKALRGTRRQLAETKAEGARTQADLAQSNEQLAQERAARAAAEAKVKDALQKLAESQQVKEEERGTVITIPGQVLFASGKSMLLPAAQSALDDVVDAVTAASDGAKSDRTLKVIVEGHTDSVGTHESNMELARNRAFAVRDYLVSRGVPQQFVEARGIGPDRPVADNGSSEGRAMNRRVEIILPPVAQEP